MMNDDTNTPPWKREKKITLPKEANVLDVFFPKQNPPRESLYRVRDKIQTIEDVRADSELTTDIVRFFKHRDLQWDKAYKDIADWNQDDFVMLLEELGLVRVNWKGLQEMTHKPVGYRPIPFAYEANKVRDFIDLAFLIDADVSKLDNRQEAEYFKEKLWQKKLARRAVFLLPSGTAWEDITIQFINPQEVIIKASGSFQKQTTYDAMGFHDRRGKLPNKQWELLRLLALNNGKLPNKYVGHLNNSGLNRIQKHKSELANELQKCFPSVEDEPFAPNQQQDAYYTIKVNFQVEDLPEEERMSEIEHYLTEKTSQQLRSAHVLKNTKNQNSD